MRIAALEAFGVDDQIVDLWRDTGYDVLLPVQELALCRHDALSGRNLLVFSPTSSGKTFVGEMAAIKMARRNRRVVYLVPQKALAEEKLREFSEKYAPLGIRTVISTRDRREFDQDINAGRFHIAVVVYEKMQGLLVSNPALLRHIGLVIADELQMIGDRERGANLEILLTKLKVAESRPQIIGLSAVLGTSRRLAEWLGAKLCRTSRRPVELRKGVLWNGAFRYVEHNSGMDGREKLAPADADASTEEVLVRQVKAFVEAGEQCLVFCKTKRDCVKTATAIAALLKGAPAGGARKGLRDLEDSRNKKLLARLFSRRVAYHNADLDADQRDLIERHFREGEIMALCATTTLALGMNLPARNVFVDPDRWDHDRTGHWTQVPISQAEYENMSGRAGRLGFEKEFGRGIIVAETEFMARTHWSGFVFGELGSIEPTLDHDPLGRHALNLVASGICTTAGEVRRVLLMSFTGETRWRGGERERDFGRRLWSALALCHKEGLIERRERGRLAASDLGRAAAVKGISVDTAVWMARFARQHREAASDVHLLEVLLCLNRTEDGERIYFNLSTDEHRSNRYLEALKDRVRGLPEGPRRRLADADGLGYVDYGMSKRLKKALILHEWLTGSPTEEIEKRYLTYAGSIAHMAREFSWLAEALASIAQVCGWPEAETSRLREIAARLVLGTPAGGIEIVGARVRGLGRGRMSALIGAGLDSLVKVAAAPREQIEKLLPKRVAKRFLKRVGALLERKQQEQDDVGTATEPVSEPPAEAVEWTPEYPPADANGSPYLSDAKVHIAAPPRGRRYLVRVDGRDVWLTYQLFEAALKLAIAAKTRDLGWLKADGLTVGEPSSYYQVIWRLKQELRKEGVDADALIENSAQHYRISVPSANVAIDAEEVEQFMPEHVKLLDDMNVGADRT